MHVLIVGGGGLGTVYAGYLARAGVDVTLLVKPAHAALCARQAVTIEGLAAFSAPVRVTADAGSLRPADYMLVCVKGRDTEAALAAVRSLAVDTVLSFQNGVAKDDALMLLFGRERVLGAISMVGAALQRPGHALHSLAMATLVGELDGAASSRGERLAATLRGAGLPAACVADIRTREWNKLALFLRTAPVAALCRLDIASVLLDPDLVHLCAGIVTEVAAVAAAEGHPLDRVEDGVIGTARRAGVSLVESFGGDGWAFRAQGPPVFPSMAQDIMSGRPTEIEETAGDVLRRAAGHD